MEEEEGFLCCSICFLTFNEEERVPKVISCGHTLCLECLTSLPTNACPECSKSFSKLECKNNQELIRCLRLWTEKLATDVDTEVSGAGAGAVGGTGGVLHGFKSAGADSISQLAAPNKRVSNITTHMCEFCEDMVAELYCHQCTKIKCFCLECFDLKHQKATSANHVYVPVKDLVLCNSHSQVCELFCTQDGCGLPAVCSECACDLRLHGGHTTCNFPDKIKEARTQLEGALRPLEVVLENARIKAALIDDEFKALKGFSLLSGDKSPLVENNEGFAGGTMQITSVEILNHGNAMRAKLESEYQRLRVVISDLEQALLAEVLAVGQRNGVALEEQLNSVCLRIGSQTSLIHRVKRELALPRGDNLVRSVPQVLSEIYESSSDLQLELSKQLAATSQITFLPIEGGDILQDMTLLRFGTVQSSNIVHSLQEDCSPGILLRHESPAQEISFISDRCVLSSFKDGEVKLLDILSGVTISAFKSGVCAYGVCASPNGRYIVIASSNNILQQWDVTSNKKIRTFEAHTQSVFSIDYSPSGELIVSGSKDHCVNVWNAQTGKLLQTFRGHTGSVHSVCFSSGYYRYNIASASSDRTVKLWIYSASSPNGLVQTLCHRGVVLSVCFSPDGKSVISGTENNEVQLWDVDSGEIKRTFVGHTRSVSSVSFSPSGRYVASGSRDRTVKLWAAGLGTLIQTFTGHNAYVNSVCFSPDERFIASGSVDKTVRLWNFAAV